MNNEEGRIPMAFHIVLVEPEIPANTGNISRTCAATGAKLHLVRPLGFSTDNARLKRAGLDYWDAVHIEYHDSFEQLLVKYSDKRFWFATTKASKHYHEVAYSDEDFLVFGKETAGLPASILDKHQEQLIRLPMTNKVRSMNLSNCAAIILFESLRQTGFRGLE
jgi:tRNA (cytidine/uridine-2'-O-)-methyltransferase